jgi:hypothetical protein
MQQQVQAPLPTFEEPAQAAVSVPAATPPMPPAFQAPQQQEFQQAAPQHDIQHEGPSVTQPGLASTVSGQGEGSELARARAIAQRLGITNLTDDEYDVPTYMRRQDREL